MYCCNFFSDVLLQFDGRPVVVDVRLALEVYSEDVIASGQIKIPCRPLNIAISWGVDECVLSLSHKDR
jgi:hypothetical protein